MVFYVKKIKKPFAGITYGPVILIKKEYKDDKGLLAHEKVHANQWWTRGLLVHSLRYRFSKDYRYQCELEAYRKQLKYSPLHRQRFVSFIENSYGLDHSNYKINKDL